MPLRRHHDMGGQPSGPVERSQHDYAPWEKRVDAIVRLLSTRRMITVDEMRRGIEEIGPGAYDEMSYYERWITSVSNLMLEKGVVTVDDLGRKMADVADRWRADAAKKGTAKS